MSISTTNMTLALALILLVFSPCLTASGNRISSLKGPIRLMQGANIEPAESNHTANSTEDSTYLIKPWPMNDLPLVITNGTFDPADLLIVESALAAVELRACITFREKRDNDTHYIVIGNRGAGCYSQLGFDSEGAEHYINLQKPNCLYHGVVVHELLHVLGMIHEHNRPERDQYVNIHWENIRDGNQYNFQKVEYEDSDSSFPPFCPLFCYGKSLSINANTSVCKTCFSGIVVSRLGQIPIPYSYESIMHYHREAFSKNNSQPTITSKLDSEATLGGEVMTENDILRLRTMYNCSAASLCGGYFSGQSGGTVTLNESSNFMTCEWFLRVPEGHIIQVAFLFFKFSDEIGDLTLSDFVMEETITTLNSSSDPTDSLYFSKGNRLRIILDRGTLNNTFSLTWKAIQADAVCCMEMSLFMAPNLTLHFEARRFYAWATGAKMFVYDDRRNSTSLKSPWSTWTRRYPWKMMNNTDGTYLYEFGPAVGCPQWLSRLNGANTSLWTITCQSACETPPVLSGAISNYRASGGMMTIGSTITFTCSSDGSKRYSICFSNQTWSTPSPCRFDTTTTPIEMSNETETTSSTSPIGIITSLTTETTSTPHSTSNAVSNASAIGDNATTLDGSEIRTSSTASEPPSISSSLADTTSTGSKAQEQTTTIPTEEETSSGTTITTADPHILERLLRLVISIWNILFA